MKLKKILLLVSIILILILLFLYLKPIYLEYKYIKVNENTLKEIESNTPNNQSLNIIDKYKKEYNNDDIIGKISIPDTNFSMLFAQTTNNDYYLNHLLNKEYNPLGSAFLDYRVNIDKDKKINIYAHNNGNIKTSFNYLMNYKNKEFFNRYNKIIINTKTNTYIYKVFSIQIVDNNYIHMKLDYQNEEEYKKYINSLLNNSIYKTNINIDEISKILTLQTCTNIKDNEYLLVNAALK